MLHEKYINEVKAPNGAVKSITYNVPENFNFAYDVVDVLAEKNPDKLAVMWCNTTGEEKRFTFGDMKALSDKAASFFQSLGITRGDKVMLILKRHHEFWYALMALHKLGAVGIPATNQLQVKDIVYRFEAADIKAVICTNESDISDRIDDAQLIVKANGKYEGLKTKIMVREDKLGWVNFGEGLEKAAPFKRPEGADASQMSDIMLLYFTSGTTGMPKMVTHDYTYPLGHIATAKYWHKVDQDGLHLTVSETGWAKSVWGKLYGQWLMEAAVFVYDFDRFVPDEILRCIEKYKITTFCAPPTMYRFFIKEDLTKYDLSSLKHTTIAGEALNPEVYEQFKKATGHKLMEGFGQTETTLTVFTAHWMEPRPGSMGLPSPAYNADIIDGEGNSAKPGVTGEIVLRLPENAPAVPGVFKGYFRDEELTDSVWYDGIYHTGDMAWRDEDGYFWYVGRTDDLIKSSGYRIGPFEVESVIMEHKAVLECAVTGEPDPVRGQVVKATIVTVKGVEPTEELAKEIQDFVKVHTAPYKYPRIVEFVSELPKTISGKIRRTEIREKGKK